MLLNERNNYMNLNYNINLIINNLNSSIENLEIPSDKIDNYYNIDSLGVDEGKLKKTRQELMNSRDYLKNVVLYEINKHLNELSNDIESMG